MEHREKVGRRGDTIELYGMRKGGCTSQRQATGEHEAQGLKILRDRTGSHRHSHESRLQELLSGTITRD